MDKEKKTQKQINKQLLIDELSKMPPMVIATAYIYAINYTLYGEDVTEKWLTATQNTCALEKAYRKGYYDAMMCELNKRKIELENQLNMSVQQCIDDEMTMCCGAKMVEPDVMEDMEI